MTGRSNPDGLATVCPTSDGFPGFPDSSEGILDDLLGSGLTFSTLSADDVTPVTGEEVQQTLTTSTTVAPTKDGSGDKLGGIDTDISGGALDDNSRDDADGYGSGALDENSRDDGGERTIIYP